MPERPAFINVILLLNCNEAKVQTGSLLSLNRF